MADKKLCADLLYENDELRPDINKSECKNKVNSKGGAWGTLQV